MSSQVVVSPSNTPCVSRLPGPARCSVFPPSTQARTLPWLRFAWNPLPSLHHMSAFFPLKIRNAFPVCPRQPSQFTVLLLQGSSAAGLTLVLGSSRRLWVGTGKVIRRRKSCTHRTFFTRSLVMARGRAVPWPVPAGCGGGVQMGGYFKPFTA